MAEIDTEWFYKLCGVALLLAVVSMLLGELCSGIRKPIRALGTVLLYGGILLALSPMLTTYGELLFGAMPKETGALLLKAMGIALLSEITSDMCRDLGENSLAGVVELGAKIVVLLLGLPMVGELLAFAARWL
jgi:stage III sporulation protein AD